MPSTRAKLPMSQPPARWPRGLAQLAFLLAAGVLAWRLWEDTRW